jgi:3',5'-cyclic AMP phosphodiesterase CpdA
MKTIAHLADLHFGRNDTGVLSALAETLARLQPDIVTIAGDLTHHARASEFEAARQYLESLPSPQIVVPGNADLSLWPMAATGRFRRLLQADLSPCYSVHDLFIAGLCTAHSRLGRGRITRGQAERLRHQLATAPPEALRVLVTHHPPIGTRPVRGRDAAAITLRDSPIDLFLVGHWHQAGAGWDAGFSGVPQSALIVHAGTALRDRGVAPCSFYLLRYERPRLAVERYDWENATARFELTQAAPYLKASTGWQAG